jgi:serine/threonine protein kinase
MRGTVEALLEMHSNGFVHRDIKLENIMISH